MTTLSPEANDITKMFENLRPEDFIRETSAVWVDPIPARAKSLGLHISNAGFEMFVRDNRDRCRQQAQDNDPFTPQAMLASSDERRFFHGEDDEVPADFARRLRREAQAMNAHWMFVALMSPARAILPGQTDPPPIDPDDADAVYAALASGELQFGVCWTAGSTVSGHPEHRAGIIYLDDHGKPGGEVEGDMDTNMNDPFADVLR